MSEIRIFSFNFAPKGWAACNGQLMPINQNQALFSLLGTTYGGDGRVNFGLPDLQGKVPIHMGNGHTLGERGGEQNHTLSTSEMPTHVHSLQASSVPGNGPVPAGNLLGSPLNATYRPSGTTAAMDPGTLANTGGSQAHPNLQPYLTLNACIALQGIFPSRN
jgi:microcystin-dependent protein